MKLNADVRYRSHRHDKRYMSKAGGVSLLFYLAVDGKCVPFARQRDNLAHCLGFGLAHNFVDDMGRCLAS